MKNRNLLLLLIFLVFCSAVIGNNFVKADSPEQANVAGFPQTTSAPNFSSATSRDGLNVYGSATLTENSQSGLSYRITVTVTSPSGRTNTTQSDWSPAPITHTTGLSIGDEDGIFSIQATFESQNGSYDEYDSFEGTGNIVSVGNSTNSIVVAPFVALRAVGFPPLQLSEISAGQTLNISAKIFASAGVPVDAVVTLEINETDVPTTQYSVIDVEDSNPTWNNATPRQVYRLIRNPGTVLETTVFRIRTQNNAPRGTIPSQIRIDDAGSIGVAQPDYINFVVNVSPATTSGGGGGGGGGIGENCFCAGGSDLMSPGNGGCNGGGVGGCPQGSTGSNGVCCWYNSPIILDIDGDGFDMTSYSGGVSFDVSGRGYPTQTSWTSADSDDAWLVLDRNENNRIDSGLEMFGDACEQPAGQTPRNGFSALAEFDRPEKGGNADGKITRRDAIFKKLRLWQDRNHDGISEAEELSRLPALDVVAIRLDFKESRRTDAFGNKFKYWAKVRDQADARVGRKAYDVFLVISPPRD